MKSKYIFIFLCLLMFESCKKTKETVIIHDEVSAETEDLSIGNQDKKVLSSDDLLSYEEMTEILIPHMISINNDELKIEISETLITCGEYKSYLMDYSENVSEMLEKTLDNIIDDSDYEISDDMPVWGLTWVRAAEYCNWLSEKQGYTPCYQFNYSEKKYAEVTINKSANGYRMPYVRELLILSGLKDGLSKDEYEQENLHGIENNINHLNVKPVVDGKKNKYGIYDLLGNLPQYCNDFFNQDYDYFDYTLSMYGPEDYTPDEDQVYFKEQLTPVRCYFGCYFCSDFEDIQKGVVWDINQISTDLIGIRIVRELNK